MKKTHIALISGVIAVMRERRISAPSLTSTASSFPITNGRPKSSRSINAGPSSSGISAITPRKGRVLLPADWFRALEQPCFSPAGCGLFADPAYLNRFGFMPSHKDAVNPDGLPVGFAIDRDYVDPDDKRAYSVVGLTCAACHSGELYYDKYAVQIDGAPAMIEMPPSRRRSALRLPSPTRSR
jgi:hypothetical protein